MASRVSAPGYWAKKIRPSGSFCPNAISHGRGLRNRSGYGHRWLQKDSVGGRPGTLAWASGKCNQITPRSIRRALTQQGQRMAYFLGIDAGGTKSEFLLGDETRELARVRSGTIQRLRTDAASAEANLDEALEELTAASGVSMLAIDRCCIGTSAE